MTRFKPKRKHYSRTRRADLLSPTTLLAAALEFHALAPWQSIQGSMILIPLDVPPMDVKQHFIVLRPDRSGVMIFSSLATLATEAEGFLLSVQFERFDSLPADERPFAGLRQNGDIVPVSRRVRIPGHESEVIVDRDVSILWTAMILLTALFEQHGVAKIEADTERLIEEIRERAGIAPAAILAHGRRVSSA